MPSRNERERGPYKRHDTRPEQKKVVVRIGPRVFTIVVQKNEDMPDHPSVGITVEKSLRMMDLTVLTLPELEMLRQFFNDAIDKALPIVADLDEAARVAAANGDTSSQRLWRPDPVRLDF